MDLVKEIKYKRLKPEERFFLEIIDGMEIKEHDKYPGSVFWVKDGDILFEQNFENEWLLVNYSKIWKVYETEFGFKYVEIKKLINGMVYEHLNWKGLTTTFWSFSPI